jgi:plasmid stabilization system protein ParE
VTQLFLTERALTDLDALERYSNDAWGKRVANRYVSDLSDALARLGDLPGLLQERPEFSSRLRFYCVREHILVCDQMCGYVFVLAIWHGAMDLMSRLKILEPMLVHEAEFLAQRIDDASRGR